MTGPMLAAFGDSVLTITWADLVVILACVVVLLWMFGRWPR